MNRFLIIGICLIMHIYSFALPSELPPKADIIKMNDAEKDSLYSINDKNTTFGIIGNIIPGMGHFYTGNWVRGLSMFCIIIGGSETIVKTTRYNEKIDTMTYSFIYNWFGLMLAFQDVVYLSESHNANLYEYIYNEKYPKKINKSITQKLIDLVDNKKIN